MEQSGQKPHNIRHQHTISEILEKLESRPALCLHYHVCHHKGYRRIHGSCSKDQLLVEYTSDKKVAFNKQRDEREMSFSTPRYVQSESISSV